MESTLYFFWNTAPNAPNTKTPVISGAVCVYSDMLCIYSANVAGNAAYGNGGGVITSIGCISPHCAYSFGGM